MVAIGLLLIRMLCDFFKPRPRLEAEILILRHQLNVLQQRTPRRRLHLRWIDRALFIWLYRRYPRILDAMRIVRPETVVRWHRKGFTGYWRWKSRGVRFRTLCADCNNGLGGKEDKTIAAFFESVKKLVESPIILTSTIKVTTRPNELYKGLMAHLVAANDNGIPSAFDIEARELFFGRKALRWSTWSLFYWIFVGSELFLMRNAYHTTWHPTVELRPLILLKLYPLAFMFVQENWFLGVPNLRTYLQPRDDEEAEVPIELRLRDENPFWPAVVAPSNVIMLAGDSFGLIGQRD
jgi:hypothetical protein